MNSLFSSKLHSTDNPSNQNFRLHMHDDYEIFLFLEGDTKYIVEENVYFLNPGDVIVIRKNQMHKAYHNSNAKYTRFVLNIAPDFFKQCNCTEYEKDFINPSGRAGSKIDAETVKSSGLYDAFMRLKKYLAADGNESSPVVRSIIIEILYLTVNIKSYSDDDTSDNQLKSVIRYINSNFEKQITLDMLEKKFFISKYHLCHIFLRATGLTVHQYIASKRYAYVSELIKSGKTITEAASLAGFSNYSSFYRGYKKVYGASPRQNKDSIPALLNINPSNAAQVNKKRLSH